MTEQQQYREGDRVQASRRLHCGVVIVESGESGYVASLSRLADDDTGLFIGWDSGSSFRVNLDEICPLAKAALPVSIADMAPGTTFTAAATEDVWRWAVREDGLIVSGLGVGPLSAIDPSTIRDVTPPKDAA